MLSDRWRNLDLDRCRIPFFFEFQFSDGTNLLMYCECMLTSTGHLRTGTRLIAVCGKELIVF